MIGGRESQSQQLGRMAGLHHYVDRRTLARLGRSVLATFPDSHVVEVVRDGRAVCVSMQMRATHVTGWPSTREGQIDLWVASVQQGLALQSDPDLRGCVTVIRYEDLKADPAAEITRLFTESGLDTSPEEVSAIAAATDIRRFPTGEGENRFRGETGAWVEHFDAEERRQFQERGGDLFEQAGYTY